MTPLTYSELKQKSISYKPSDLVDELGFEDTLNMARHMLNNKKWDESLQEYATNLLEELRKKYFEKWNSNWKYDAFLGYAYDIILKYDERYASYKRAFDKTSLPPPELLVAIAGCCWAPGQPSITEEEAISFVKQAIETTPYVEGVELLRGLYKSIGNVKEQQYWEKVLEEIKDNGPHLPPLDRIS
jgi:hypothetical protein